MRFCSEFWIISQLTTQILNVALLSMDSEVLLSTELSYTHGPSSRFSAFLISILRLNS